MYFRTNSKQKTKNIAKCKMYLMRDCTKQKQYNELCQIVKQKTENISVKEDKQLLWQTFFIFYVNKSIKLL